MAVDRTPFHKQCVKCKQCGKGLNSATLNEHDKQLYCKPCYENVFVNAVSFDLLLWKKTFIQKLISDPPFWKLWWNCDTWGPIEEGGRREEEAGQAGETEAWEEVSTMWYESVSWGLCQTQWYILPQGIEILGLK